MKYGTTSQMDIGRMNELEAFKQQFKNDENCPFCKCEYEQTTYTEIEKKELKISGMCGPCQKDFFDQEEKTPNFVTPRSKEREERRIARQCPKAPNKVSITDDEAEAWAAELSAAENKQNGDYDHMYLMRGLHRIQVNGGTAQDENRFLNNVLPGVFHC